MVSRLATFIGIFPQAKWELVDFSALLQMLVVMVLRLHKHEERNSHNLDFISEPAWSINSGWWNLGQGLSQASGVGEQVSYSMVKSPKKLWPSGVETVQRLATSDTKSGPDLLSLTGKIHFLTNHDTMKCAETGRWEKCVQPTCQLIEGTPW